MDAPLHKRGTLTGNRPKYTSVLLALVVVAASLRAADFQIVWVTIGDAAAVSGGSPVRAGRHLFMASELAQFALRQVSVARVEVSPEIKDLAIGERFCLTSLRITAVDGQREPVKQAPLSVSVRQDHRDTLGLERRKNDICVRPIAAGEYPIRFTSLVPAADGTTRGAQMFLRVHGPQPLATDG